ncbi:conserved membrane hypothetical protein [Vibrio nigripulchritudo SO65]|uniref:hypothetical protein n=1 Tax=Vibrio nigripulchritudo TaxID=28173 RepID=UPI0003B1E004|nr:hypothetical protein [Vibrio nigripulchritudo]CCN38129.1 conserved membrane hypothetical protein [Vibrio nigripulchritudo AM115]CCN43842.1 conserved membrane hypothetical protein [Vibrio nigripulchritudo FTn2]CCN64618.1 conserved membrane hypothetical protein [Vibrio nigripulchritudo POn4]CCN77124.1 conserved membrane hypothetical protein [Vibrio nigripulchritudo SO65]
MNYLPKMFAKKFGYFASLSLFAALGYMFGSTIVMILLVIVVSELNGLLIGPLFSGYILFVLGVMAAKFYSRKSVILTDPIAVKIASTDISNNVSKIGNSLFEWVFLLFFHFILLGAVLFLLAPLLALAFR